MTPAQLLKDANLGAWESVQSALASPPDELPKRARWLVQHIFDTKRACAYSSLIAQALSQPVPLQPTPSELDLAALTAQEVQQAAKLTPAELGQTLRYDRQMMTVGEALLLRHFH